MIAKICNMPCHLIKARKSGSVRDGYKSKLIKAVKGLNVCLCLMTVGIEVTLLKIEDQNLKSA